LSLIITNKCLTLLGAEPVASVTDSEWGIIINATVPGFYLNLLQKYDWSFSILFSELIQNTVSANPRYDFSFAIPSDFIRIKQVYETDSFESPLFRYTIDGANLYAKFDRITINYVSDGFDVDKTPESFKLALAYRILANLNARLLNDPQLIEYYERMDLTHFNEAVNLDNTNRGLLPQMTQVRRYF